MADDLVARLAMLAGVAAIVLIAARAIGRRPNAGDPIDLRGLGLPAGLVLFTSTDCTNCATVRTMMEAAGLRPREVTWELEPETMERAGVIVVPLTVVVDGDGVVHDRWAGVPPSRWMGKAAAAARRLAPPPG
ncbi:hypothetical protein BH24ACT7_BH24ACT7_01500 [soil metagenome]